MWIVFFSHIDSEKLAVYNQDLTNQGVGDRVGVGLSEEVYNIVHTCKVLSMILHVDFFFQSH